MLLSSEWSEDTGLRVDSELLYKNLSETRDKNNAARCERRANRGNKVQAYTTRKRFKLSNICGDPSEDVSRRIR